MPSPSRSSTEPIRRALLIGASRVRDVFPNALRGSVNDVRLMESVLLQHGFCAEDITVLLDEQATRIEITGALDRMATELPRNAAVVLYFTGHNANVLREGQKPVLLPFDFSREAPQTALHYSELRSWLEKLRADRVIVIVDTGNAEALIHGLSRSGVICLGASKANESSYEFLMGDGVWHGVFTYFLCQSLLRAEPGATYLKVVQRTAARILTLFPVQHPSIDGDWGQTDLLGAPHRQPEDPVITKRTGREVTIDVGAVDGVTTQSLWAVYPALGLTPAEKIGTIEITAVRSADTLARVVSESREGTVGARSRIVEEAHHYGDMALGYAIAAEHSEETAISISKLRSILASAELLSGTKEPDVVLRVGRSGLADQYATERTEFDKPMWHIEDDQARAVMPPSPVHDPVGVRYKLETLARYRNALALVNPHRSSALAGRVVLRLLVQLDGDWIEPSIDLERGICVLYTGDKIRIEVHNRHDTPVYINVFDFGLARTIRSLGEEDHGWQIDPDETLYVGQDGMKMYFPREYGGESGIETIKMFATEHPIDWSALLSQQGARDLSVPTGQSTELFQLLDMALTGRGARERRPVQLPRGQHWTTDQHTFELRRSR